MNIDITARKFKLTPSIETYANEKVSKLSKFQSNITEIRVILEVDDGHHRHGRNNGCEIIIHTPREHKEFFARTWTDDMHKSINQAVSEMEKELMTHKGKHLVIDHEEIRAEKMEIPEVGPEEEE
ncbi:MAG: ribosome-associated translation inhibitor RaiA [Patescibacteria group bacterium]|nr:ribosome-associated translation inhibitor RaiA [Patescibacteria group bacterium]